MNSKQDPILKDIFTRPTKSNISWKDIEKLMISLGAKIKEGKVLREYLYLKKEFFHSTDHILRRKQKDIKLKI